MTAKEASLAAAIAMAFAIWSSLSPRSRPAAALCEIDEPRLDCVGQCHREHEGAPAGPYVVGDRKRHAEIIRRVARFRWRKEVVHEIDVAHESSVPECCVNRVCLSAANQRTRADTPELADLIATGVNGTGA
jgi:hypothetical protein